MTVNLNDLYGAYAELEGIPAKADAEAKAASAARSAASAAAEADRKSTNQSYDGKAAAATGRQRSSHDGFESQLRTVAQSAGAKGAIATGHVAGTGRAPDFSAAKALDTRLAQSIEDNRRLELELEQLTQQLAREGNYSEARAKDVITFVLGGIGLLVAVVAGANIVGAVVAVVSASIMQYRLSHGPSAFVDREAMKRPAVQVNRRVKSGVTRVFGGWVILITVVVVAIASPLLWALFPFWSEQNFGSGGSGDIGQMLLAWLSSVLFWGAGIHGVILLITGYRRRAGG